MSTPAFAPNRRLNADRPNFSAFQQTAGLAGFLAATFVTGGIGAIASVNAATFYAQLQQPSWAPPAGVFGPVWSLLYALMAIAAWLVWRKHGFGRAAGALQLFSIQLVANMLWSWLFFAGHWGALSLADIVLLWLLIVATTWAFWQRQRAAALLMLPYLAWVSFAGVLNYVLWQSNPALLG